jgi:hypothetical protein
MNQKQSELISSFMWVLAFIGLAIFAEYPTEKTGLVEGPYAVNGQVLNSDAGSIVLPDKRASIAN